MEARIRSASSSRSPYLKSKLQVGSVKSGTLDYGFKEKVFSGHDVPPEVRDVKAAVQKQLRGNILCTQKLNWNQSTIADQRIEKDTTKDLRCQLLRVRSGLMDEHTLKPSKMHSDEAVADRMRHIVAMTGQGPIGKLTGKWFNAVDERSLPSHCIEAKWPDWDASTSTFTKEDRKQREEMLQRQQARRSQMLAHKPKMDESEYINPMQATINLNDTLRQSKIEFQDLKDQIKKELSKDFPDASEERLQAMAQRLLYEKMLADGKSRRLALQQPSFRPNVSLTAQDRRYKEYHHPGSWSWNEAEHCNCWSCCLNFVENSRGCESKVVNPDAWCTLGFERWPGVATAWK